MTRGQYYLALDLDLKNRVGFSIGVEEYDDEKDEWLCVSGGNGSVYCVSFYVDGMKMVIPETGFDKFFGPYAEYPEKGTTMYSPNDVAISVNNLKYMILNEIQRKFFK